MSENSITVIPLDHAFVPNESAESRLLVLMQRIIPDCDELQIEKAEEIRFFDAGSNFERIICPQCHQEIPISWWQEAMDLDYGDIGFHMKEILSPCCAHKANLNQLLYEWEQGFAKFALVARNPNRNELSIKEIDTIEEVIRQPVRVIYQRL